MELDNSKIVELASKFAHEVVKEILNTTDDDMVLEEEGSDCTIYKDNVQILFDEWYDYFFDNLINVY